MAAEERQEPEVSQLSQWSTEPRAASTLLSQPWQGLLVATRRKIVHLASSKAPASLRIHSPRVHRRQTPAHTLPSMPHTHRTEAVHTFVHIMPRLIPHMIQSWSTRSSPYTLTRKPQRWIVHTLAHTSIPSRLRNHNSSTARTFVHNLVDNTTLVDMSARSFSIHSAHRKRPIPPAVPLDSHIDTPIAVAQYSTRPQQWRFDFVAMFVFHLRILVEPSMHSAFVALVANAPNPRQTMTHLAPRLPSSLVDFDATNTHDSVEWHVLHFPHCFQVQKCR